jgi:hypothetical protein
MKLQNADWCRGAQELAPAIAMGRLRSDASAQLINGTYLEAWWRCLKFSKEFTQCRRTGIFTSKESFNTFRMFGPLENISFNEWWITKGHVFFSESITTLQVKLYGKCSERKTFALAVDALQDVSSNLAGREFEFWLNQIALLNQGQGLLSEAPLSWPIFKSRISLTAISQLISLLEIHDQIIRNAPETRLWQIGEQLRIKPHAMPRAGDYASDIADKHKAMGQTISNYLKKGTNLVHNASVGFFPCFSNK